MQQNKPTKRQAQALKTKNKIYKISLNLIKKYGFDNVTIDDISKKAGVSVGAFYHYFESKSDIFNEIYKQADDYFQSYVVNNLAGCSSFEKIQDFFGYYARFNLSNGLEFVRQLYNSHNTLFIKKGRYMQSLLCQLVIDGQSAGEITTEYSSEKIVDFLFISVRGIIFDWCLHDGSYKLDDAIHNSTKLLLAIFKSK